MINIKPPTDQEDNLQDGEINSTVLNLYIIGFI